MPKLSVITPKKLIKVLNRIGFRLDHKTGSHFIFYHPSTRKRAVVPVHQEEMD